MPQGLGGPEEDARPQRCTGSRMPPQRTSSPEGRRVLASCCSISGGHSCTRGQVALARRAAGATLALSWWLPRQRGRAWVYRRREHALLACISCSRSGMGCEYTNTGGARARCVRSTARHHASMCLPRAGSPHATRSTAHCAGAELLLVACSRAGRGELSLRAHGCIKAMHGMTRDAPPCLHAALPAG